MFRQLALGQHDSCTAVHEKCNVGRGLARPPTSSCLSKKMRGVQRGLLGILQINLIDTLNLDGNRVSQKACDQVAVLGHLAEREVEVRACDPRAFQVMRVNMFLDIFSSQVVR